MTRATTVPDLTVPHSSGTRPPSFTVPADACDCHMHVYDSRVQVAPGATLRPPDASVADYVRLQRRVGTTRTVVVTPSTYGTDNRVTLAALAALGSSARAVAVVDASVSDDELQALHDAGVRGIRFNLSLSQVATMDMLVQLAPRVAELGWHAQVLMPTSQLLQHATALAELPVQVVFDHFGRLPFAEGAQHPAFALIARLLREERAWVKLSGVYINSLVGPPSYEDATPLARAYVSLAPDRVLWGSDWPHVLCKYGQPDDAELVDLLLDWAPDESVRKKILVTNPARLYGY
jgi:predicted TIM-barrel fold metal-dependent hydrolase